MSIPHYLTVWFILKRVMWHTEINSASIALFANYRMVNMAVPFVIFRYGSKLFELHFWNQRILIHVLKILFLCRSCEHDQTLIFPKRMIRTIVLLGSKLFLITYTRC